VIEDRILGGLLGVATGDALGATVEFMSPAAIRSYYGQHTEILGGGVFDWRPGQGTDDTDMTACVARAYAAGYDLDAVSSNFLGWYRGGPRDIGGMTAAALRHLQSNGDPRESGALALAGRDPRATAGNGSLMRALPTALAQSDAAARIREAAEISAVTHADPRCVQACIAYVDLAGTLVDGASVPDALEATIERANDRSALADVTAALTVDPGRPVTSLPTTGYVLDSLAAAVWAIQQPRPAEALLVDVVNQGDDADTTGAIVGGLLGVRDGARAFPRRWIDQLEYRDELTSLAPLLARRRAGDEGTSISA